MRVIVIGTAGHIGTYLIPMLVNAGYETNAITRKMSAPYEDAPAWRKPYRLRIPISPCTDSPDICTNFLDMSRK